MNSVLELTADSARKKANNCDPFEAAKEKLLNKVFEEIRSASADGEFETDYNFTKVDAGVFNHVHSTLNDLGYKVLIHPDLISGILAVTISWKSELEKTQTLSKETTDISKQAYTVYACLKLNPGLTRHELSQKLDKRTGSICSGVNTLLKKKMIKVIGRKIDMETEREVEILGVI